MTNRNLTDREIDKILILYEPYRSTEESPSKLPDFLRMIWAEAYDLGVNDGYINGWNEGREELKSSR